MEEERQREVESKGLGGSRIAETRNMTNAATYPTQGSGGESFT